MVRTWLRFGFCVLHSDDLEGAGPRDRAKGFGRCWCFGQSESTRTFTGGRALCLRLKPVFGSYSFIAPYREGQTWILVVSLRQCSRWRFTFFKINHRFAVGVERKRAFAPSFPTESNETRPHAFSCFACSSPCQRRGSCWCSCLRRCCCCCCC